MQGVINQGTINVLIDSSVKQKFNLHLGQTYEARVFSVADDGKVIIKIGGNEIVAETKVPLQPGQKILVEVKDTTNGKVILQIKNNLSLGEMNPSNLIRESIINNLLAQKLPLKEENIVISQGLIKYNLRVSSDNIQKVLNGLTSSGYQNQLADYKIVESGVLLFAKGLPITRETVELARFLKQEKGQVITDFEKTDNQINEIIKNIAKSLQQPEGEIALEKLPKALKEILLSLPNKLGEQQLPLIFAKNNSKESQDNQAKIAGQPKDVMGQPRDMTQPRVQIDQTKDLISQTKKTIGEPVDLALSKENKGAIESQPSINNANGITTSDKIIDISKTAAWEKGLENLRTLTELKGILSKAFLNIQSTDQGNSSDNLMEAIKHVARYMVEGDKSLERDIQNKLQGSLKELVTKIILETVLTKQEHTPSKGTVLQPAAETILKEQIGQLEGNFKEITKHFDAVKLYNAGINDTVKDNINNYYLLSMPTLVAGEKLDNKIYFWSQGKKNKKIDPENMRIVLCLNTNSLGLLRIDLTVAKRDIYAGIEVTDPKVQDFIQAQSSELELQFAAHNYRLRAINCTHKKVEDISLTPTHNHEHFSALDLKV